VGIKQTYSESKNRFDVTAELAGQTTQKKKDKWTNNDLQSLHRKLKFEQHDPY
jgi:hypothetical protein